MTVAVKAFLKNEIINKWCGENTDHKLNNVHFSLQCPRATTTAVIRVFKFICFFIFVQ